MRTATPNAIYTQQAAKAEWQGDINAKFSHLLLAQLPRTRQFTHSKAPNPNASKTSTENFRISYWHSYPKHNLHTARRQTRMQGRHQHPKFSHFLWHNYPEHNLHTARHQTRMQGRHQHKIIASPLGTATRHTIYTRQGTPACQQDINTKFSHLLLAQLPRTQFTHSKAPNPNASKTSTQNFRISFWHSYPEHNLHTASRQTRMPGRQRKISQLLLAQLPRTQFTHSKAPNPHARKTSRQNFRISYWHSYPERNLHTASRQTRMPGKHQHKFSRLQLAQLPRTQFTHSTPPNPNASKTSPQNFRICYRHSYPKHNLHTASRQTRMPGKRQRKIFASPIGTTTPYAIYTQQGAKPA